MAKGISTASRKAKGRELQNWTRDQIRSNGLDLEDDDVTGRSMGASGEDILLSPKARKQFPFSLECKRRKSFAVYSDFDQAVSNCNGYTPVLVIRGDRKKPLVVVDAEWFFAQWSDLYVCCGTQGDNASSGTGG